QFCSWRKFLYNAHTRKIRNWHLDISDDSVGVFYGEHDLFYDKTIEYYIYNYPSSSSNKWVGCDLQGEFDCQSRTEWSEHLHWYDQPLLQTIMAITIEMMV
ncbi:MAG: hypothetical protein OMM_15254, partial [Candidatus Magnetoglobus multicellularis str. Araruama]